MGSFHPQPCPHGLLPAFSAGTQSKDIAALLSFETSQPLTPSHLGGLLVKIFISVFHDTLPPFVPSPVDITIPLGSLFLLQRNCPIPNYSTYLSLFLALSLESLGGNGLGKCWHMSYPVHRPQPRAHSVSLPSLQFRPTAWHPSASAVCLGLGESNQERRLQFSGRAVRGASSLLFIHQQHRADPGLALACRRPRPLRAREHPPPRLFSMRSAHLSLRS